MCITTSIPNLILDLINWFGLVFLKSSLKTPAAKIIAKEQAGFSAGRSTTEQNLNLRIFCLKHLEYHQDLYCVFIDFKKAFNRVWHAALWAIMKKYSIIANLIPVIKHL